MVYYIILISVNSLYLILFSKNICIMNQTIVSNIDCEIQKAKNAENDEFQALQNLQKANAQSYAANFLLQNFPSILNDDDLKLKVQERADANSQAAFIAQNIHLDAIKNTQNARNNVLSKIEQLLGKLSMEIIQKNMKEWEIQHFAWYLLFLAKKKDEQNDVLSKNKLSLKKMLERFSTRMELGFYPKMNEIQMEIKNLESQIQNWIDSDIEPCHITRMAILVLKEIVQINFTSQ
jgi:hypothetical protein